MYWKWKANFARCCSATPSMDRKFAVEVMQLLARCPLGIQQIRSSKIVENSLKCLLWLCSVFCEYPSFEKKDKQKNVTKLTVCTVLPLWFVPVFLEVDIEWCLCLPFTLVFSVFLNSWVAASQSWKLNLWFSSVLFSFVKCFWKV